MSDVKKRGRGRPESTLLSRFNAGHIRGEEDECWDWIGRKDKDGYGLTSLKCRGLRAHRAAWMLVHGDIPKGACVCHRCDNPSCVNHKHLFLGTIAENNRDRSVKGRSAWPMARFTKEDVLSMRSLSACGHSYSAIGRTYKTSASTVRNAVLGLTWSSLEK